MRNGEYVMESDLSNLLKTSNSAKPIEFQSQLNDILGQRIAAALDRRKQDMAQSLFVSADTEIPDSGESSNTINNDETDLADTEEHNNDQDS